LIGVAAGSGGGARDGGKVMPLFGKPDVEKLKAKGDIKGLAKALRYRRDSGVRRDAARVLGEIRAQTKDATVCEQVAQAFVEALRVEACGERDAIADSLELMCTSHEGTTFCAPAIAPLTSLLKDTKASFSVRRTAIRLLGGIPDGRAVQTLVGALGPWRLDMRRAAAESLVALYRSGQLDDTARQAILEKRSTITRRHEDWRSPPHHDTRPHVDSYNDCASHADALREHTDRKLIERHTDQGLGVRFPI
jgi:hypothetical protein